MKPTAAAIIFVNAKKKISSYLHILNLIIYNEMLNLYLSTICVFPSRRCIGNFNYIIA